MDTVRDAPLAGVDHLVVVCPSWVGDTVMATPVLRALRAALPEARITAVMRPGLDVMLAGTPWLDERIPMSMKGLAGPVRASRRLRRLSADAILLLPNSLRSGLTARLSRIPVRIGYRRDGRGWTLTHGLDVTAQTKPTSTVHYYAALGAFALGGTDFDLSLELGTTAEEEDAADAILDGVTGPFVLLCPGGNKLPKRWGPDRFGAVADDLAERHGLSVVVTGSPGEAEVVAEVAGATRGGAVDLVSRGVTLGSLKAVIRRAALVVTNDTGPRHIAAGVGTPVVTLFGPTDHRWALTGSPCERAVLAEPFLPEELVADAHADTCRIDRIAIRDVVAVADDLLALDRA